MRHPQSQLADKILAEIFIEGSNMKLKKSFLSAVLVTAMSVSFYLGTSVAQAEGASTTLPTSGPLSKQTMSRLLLTDGVRFGNRIVAVGDRGYIVFSDSNGESWERAQTPPNLPLLTAVYFADAKTGWAVGHDAVILKSSDEGKTWSQAFSAAADQKPLMDITFVDANVGFAVGAYGAFYETADAGKTWAARKIQEEDKHLNAILKIGEGKFLIVGEAGTLLKSDDAGKTWGKVESPYKGSFFGGVLANDGSVTIYGLRGRIFRSADASLKSWQQYDNKSTASIMGATKLPDGALVLAGLAGTVLISRDNGQTYSALATGSTKSIAAPLLGGPNALVLLGEVGARDVLLSGTSAGAVSAGTTNTGTTSAPPVPTKK
jgi:photosystem II stability/assembly factor-like uncharacterized protein